MRVGIGYDVHPLLASRKLVLGGVELAYAKGLSGWSDGDVLAHAIIDALLGAAALGDIGKHFPSGEPQYKDISSLVLLGKVKGLLDEKKWRIVNIDATVVAEKPRLSSHTAEMCQGISHALGIETSQVNVKATTAKKLGSLGQGQGIAVYAIALIEGRE